jgi:hypothetical protein
MKFTINQVWQTQDHSKELKITVTILSITKEKIHYTYRLFKNDALLEYGYSSLAPNELARVLDSYFPLAEEKTTCNHSFEIYHGFTDIFEFCRLCDLRKN